jgi:CubicO group peptidase (beta-lactamase class C family)
MASMGFDESHWHALLDDIRRRGLRVDQVALMVDGQLVAQHHRAGFDERSLHDLRSVTKSVTSLLTGIAMDRGLLPGVDARLGRVAAQPALSLRHLLTMRSGLDCDDWRASSVGNEERMYRSPNWLEFFSRLPALRPPGDVFSYCTSGVVALGDEVARAANEPLQAVARRWLFEPLGIAGEVWAGAPAHTTDAGGHLRLTLHAMLKLGELMRNGGRWQGRAVVSEDWVHNSLRSSGPVDPQGRHTSAHMGFLWWLEPLDADGQARSFQARGNGGQYIIVIPALKMVAAFTGHAYNASPEETLAPLVLVSRYLAPMVRKQAAGG